MKKALMYATTASMIKQFNMENIQLLQKLGYQVEVACNFKQGSSITPEKVVQFQQELNQMGIPYYQIPLSRSLFNVAALIKSISQSVKLMNQNQYDLIHCHTPIGSVVCRLANRLSRHYQKTRMIYTAHGFHFFKGAPIKNWLLFYPVEKICSWFTDVLILLNAEDYTIAKDKMHAKDVVYLPGVGVDTYAYRNISASRQQLREKLGIPENKVWVLSVGELIPRKNQETLICAAAQVPQLFVTIAGRGERLEYLEKLIEELGVQDRVKMLGFRSDVPEMCTCCDIFAFPSLQEGLPVAVMEAMACGRAVVCTDIRGNHDLIVDGKGGFLLPVKDVSGFADKLSLLAQDDALRQKMGEYNQEFVKKLDISVVNEKMRQVYSGK